MKPEVNRLAFCWYPKNKSEGHELEMYYCIPLKVGEEYCTCHIFYGDIHTRLRTKGTFSDVLTKDIQPLPKQLL
jgi:hypothetical protein